MCGTAEAVEEIDVEGSEVPADEVDDGVPDMEDMSPEQLAAVETPPFPDIDMTGVRLFIACIPLD